jgi:heptosyltransferase III
MRNRHTNLNGKRIIVSRTDSIGDVVLALPVTAILKRLFPECTLIFLGRGYTKNIIECCEYIDEFADWDEIKINKKDAIKSLRADAIIHVFPRKEIAIAARSAGIPLRLGTSSRLYHWGQCNKLIRLSRRRSSLHESQLNLKLLHPLGAKRLFTLPEIPLLYGLSKVKPLKEEYRKLIDPECFYLLLHPGSRGSSREWGLHNFARLIELLPDEKFKVFITGTREEGESVKNALFEKFPRLINLCGKFNLHELISFIANTEGMVATSTGPLHLASALGRNAIGIYPPIRPMHPGRWSPVGNSAYSLVTDHDCNRCRKRIICKCMDEVTPEMIREKLFEIFH